MKISHIYWFANYNPDSPSVRYRIKYPIEELHKHGVSSSFVYPGYRLMNIFHFISVYISALLFRKQQSIIIFQNIHTNRIYSSALKFLLFFKKYNTLYDIDDADYLRFEARTINYFIKKCKGCSAGSNALVEYAKNYNPNVFLLTSPVIKHNYIKTKRNQIFTIGWIGFYNAHRNSLIQLLFPAIKEMDFKLKLILLGVVKKEHEKEIKQYFSHNPNVIIEMPGNIDWHNERSIYEYIMNFDVGVSPLLGTEFNQAKSAFKLKQYLSCGVPALASRIGENCRFLHEGFNGYFCDTSKDYKNNLVKIKNLSDEEYYRLSHNARDSIRDFSIEDYCNTLLGFYEN